MQLAYLFPTLVIHTVGVYRRDYNDVVVCYIFYLTYAFVNIGHSIAKSVA